MNIGYIAQSCDSVKLQLVFEIVAALHIYPFLGIFCLTRYIRCVLNSIHSSLLHFIITLTWGQGLNQDCLRSRTEVEILIFLSHWNTTCIVSLLISLPVIVWNSEGIYNKGFNFQHRFLNTSQTDHNPCVKYDHMLFSGHTKWARS